MQINVDKSGTAVSRAIALLEEGASTTDQNASDNKPDNIKENDIHNYYECFDEIDNSKTDADNDKDDDHDKKLLIRSTTFNSEITLTV